MARFRVEFQITKRAVLVTWIRCLRLRKQGSAAQDR